MMQKQILQFKKSSIHLVAQQRYNVFILRFFFSCLISELSHKSYEGKIDQKKNNIHKYKKKQPCIREKYNVGMCRYKSI